MSEPLAAAGALSVLESSGALLSGHFRLSSGAHSDRYIQCARALEHPARSEPLGGAIAALARPFGAHTVAAPAVGGLIIGHEVARALGVRFIFAEREENRFALRRGFAMTPGERLLLVEDVLTTGGSVSELRTLVEAAGATAVAIGAIVDRTDGAFHPGIPLLTLVTLDVPRYPADACPLCARGVPLVKPGSRPA